MVIEHANITVQLLVRNWNGPCPGMIYEFDHMQEILLFCVSAEKRLVLCIVSEINIDIELANFGTAKSSQYAQCLTWAELIPC